MYRISGLSAAIFMVLLLVLCTESSSFNETYSQIESNSTESTTTTTKKLEIKVVPVVVVVAEEKRPSSHEVRLGIDFEYTANEHETLKLICPVDLDSSTWQQQQPDDEDENGVEGEDGDEENTSTYEEVGADEDWISSSEYEDDANKRRKRAFSTTTRTQKLILVEWSKDGAKINKYKSSDRLKIEDEGASLKIIDVTPNDSGKYRCKYISGFRTLTASAVNVIVIAKTTDSSQQIATTKATNKAKSSLQQAPVFIGSNKSGSRTKLTKRKGSSVRFNCRAFGVPKPDVLWFRNGQVLSEEEYGITRSKSILDLKDLRMDDNANFTCKVFNKFGFINSTFDLTVYEEAQIFEGLDPLNSTITVGMDAVFNCKVKSSSQPNIKWMKQISKKEYKNYIIEEENNNDGNNKQILSSSKSRRISTGLNQAKRVDDEDFFALSTLPSLGAIGKFNSRSINGGGEESGYLADLMDDRVSSNKEKSQRSVVGGGGEDDFKFDFFLPSSSNDAKSISSFETYLNRIGLKKNNNNNDHVEHDDDDSSDDESSHYITLSSPQVEERLSYNPERNVYVSQLILKNAQVKDSGVYVCFGAGNNGYSYRKSHLKVIPSILLYKDFSAFNYGDLEGVKLVETSVKKQQQSTTISQSSSFSFQSIGFFIILVPVVIITLLALVSICYLRKLDSNNQTTSRYQCIFGKICCVGGEKKRTGKNGGQNNGYLCCPTSTLGTHVLIPADSSTYEAEIEFVKHHIRPMYEPKTSSPETCVNKTNTTTTNHSSLVSSSLSDSASSSSSTTATTVAYYATIPLLAAADCHLAQPLSASPPPPLPQSQPPTYIHSPSPSFHHATSYHQATSTIDPRSSQSQHQQPQQQQLSRTESTPSMAYYKIVDSDLMLNSNAASKAPLAVDNDDTMTCVSAATSRFYYQLTPSITNNYNDLRRNIQNNY